MLLLLPRGRLVEVGDGGGEAAYIAEMKWNVMDKKTKNYDNDNRICMVVKENDKCKRVEILVTCIRRYRSHQGKKMLTVPE